MGRFFRVFFIFLVLLFAAFYTVVPKVAYEDLGGKEVINALNPPMTLSDQPDIIRVEKSDKKLIRFSQLDLYLELIGGDLLHLPRVIANYSDIDRFKKPVTGDFFGIFADPLKNNPAFLIENLRELGVRNVGLRIYYRDGFVKSADFEKLKSFAAQLKNNGFDVFVVIAQNFEAMRSKNLESFFQDVFSGFSDTVSTYQIGEAINRIKWGVVLKGDYKKFFDAALQAKNAYDVKQGGELKFAAPSVIDFEWYYTMYYLDVIGRDNVDIQNTLLYVDRRGWPENTQYGFDTVDKIEVMKAIAPKKPLWITEVNWPLKGTDDYKPTSEDEAVNTQAYADYLVRYMLLAYASGLVDRVYWWQLSAKGYGLIDHLDLKRYEAFDAYRFLAKNITGLSVQAAYEDDGAYKLVFSDGLREVDVRWCVDDSQKCHSVIKRDRDKKYYNSVGKEIDNPEVTTSPIYAIESMQ